MNAESIEIEEVVKSRFWRRRDAEMVVSAWRESGEVTRWFFTPSVAECAADRSLGSEAQGRTEIRHGLVLPLGPGRGVGALWLTAFGLSHKPSVWRS